MKKGKKAVIIFGGILLMAVMAVLCITGRITRTVVSESGTAYEQKVDLVAFGYRLEQRFVPQYENLDTVKIHVDAAECSRDCGALQVSILDADGIALFLTEIPVSDLPLYGWVEIPVCTQLAPGCVSTFQVESIGCVDYGPRISFLDARLAATPEQEGFSMVFAGMEAENSVLRMAFRYAVPIEPYEYIVYGIFGLFLLILTIL